MIDPKPIEPGAFYGNYWIEIHLGIQPAHLDQAVKNGDLRSVRKTFKKTKYRPEIQMELFKGQWLLDWLDPKPAIAPNPTTTEFLREVQASLDEERKSEQTP